MNRAQNHNPSYLALITLISHMPHFEQILAESICQEKAMVLMFRYCTSEILQKKGFYSTSRLATKMETGAELEVILPGDQMLKGQFPFWE